MLSAIVHSLRVKAFREAQGIKAKTDRIDARLLRDYGRNRLNAGKLRLGRREDVADAVVWAATRPARVNINVIELMPVTQAFGPLVVHRGGQGGR